MQEKFTGTKWAHFPLNHFVIGSKLVIGFKGWLGVRGGHDMSMGDEHDF
jgi:hypothetical protein